MRLGCRPSTHRSARRLWSGAAVSAANFSPVPSVTAALPAQLVCDDLRCCKYDERAIPNGTDHVCSSTVRAEDTLRTRGACTRKRRPPLAAGQFWRTDASPEHRSTGLDPEEGIPFCQRLRQAGRAGCNLAGEELQKHGARAAPPLSVAMSNRDDSLVLGKLSVHGTFSSAKCRRS